MCGDPEGASWLRPQPGTGGGNVSIGVCPVLFDSSSPCVEVPLRSDPTWLFGDEVLSGITAQRSVFILGGVNSFRANAFFLRVAFTQNELLA